MEGSHLGRKVANSYYLRLVKKFFSGYLQVFVRFLSLQDQEAQYSLKKMDLQLSDQNNMDGRERQQIFFVYVKERIMFGMEMIDCYC